MDATCTTFLVGTGDFDWRQRFVRVNRNFVEGEFTTPKNGTLRNVDMSFQFRAVLRLWRRQQRATWLKAGRPFPDLVFPSVAGTVLDDSNIRMQSSRGRRSVGGGASSM